MFSSHIKKENKLVESLCFEVMPLHFFSYVGMVGASFVVFGATILFELLKLVKLYLDLKMRENPLAGQSTCEEMPEESRETNHDGVILLNSLRIPVSRQIRARK